MTSSRPWLYRHAAEVAAVTALLFVAVAFLVALGATAASDFYARDLAASWATEPVHQMAVLASEAGTARYLVGIAILAGLLVARSGRRRDAILPMAVLVAEWLANPLIKAIYHRQRPTDAFWDPGLFGSDQYAFPSGHAMASMALFSLLACWVWAWWPWRGRLMATIVVGLIPIVIGLSRVVLGVHWLSDVAGGWLAGAMVTSLTVLVWFRTGQKEPS